MSDTALAFGPVALTHIAAYPVLSDVVPRYSDLGGDGLITPVGLGRWFEDARVGVELPGFRRLVEDGEFGVFRILLAAQHIERFAPMPSAASRGGCPPIPP